MNLDELAGHMGADIFRRACERAVASAAVTGRRSMTGGGLHGEQAEIPHEPADLVEGDLDLAMALYLAMPCYANLMYVGHWAPRADLFRELRALWTRRTMRGPIRRRTGSGANRSRTTPRPRPRRGTP